MFAATRAGVMTRKQVAGPTYRYWRLSISAQNGDTSYAALAEIQLRPVAGDATATTAQTPVSASIHSYPGIPGYPLSNLVDGALSTLWISAPTPAFPFTLTLDLGTPTAINEVAIYPQLYATSRAPSQFTVLGSLDGINFTNVKEFVDVFSWADGQFNTFAL